ncbi:MAG TPA: ATP-grasp domain-containing protein [Pyrinomonadaceae bacterium]|nr:ATP-grasp domain-containing protein [Pyrinomonadaceae bacterium]
MNSRERILILDGHTNQALACVRSLGVAGYGVLVASHRASPLAKWSRHCRAHFRLEGQSTEAFAAMREWAKKQGVRLVLPVTERSCVLLNAERAAWEAEGVIVGCAQDEVLTPAFDKAQTMARAEKCGVRIPRSHAPRSLAEALEAAEAIGLPCVVKPRWSNAWDGRDFSQTLSPAYVGRREDLAREIEARRQHADWPLVQEYVAGQGKGVFALCEHGRAVAWFAHERLRDTRPSGSGSSLRRSVRLEPRLREPAERLLSELKWHGPAMVEFRDDGAGAPCLMEVNGRFWGSLQLGIDAGVNFPLLWVAILKGERVEPALEYAEGVTLRWLWGDIKRFMRILRGAPPGYPGKYPTVMQGVKELFGPQPAGTRLEVWRAGDLWPGLGEWAGAFREFLAWRTQGRSKKSVQSLKSKVQSQEAGF